MANQFKETELMNTYHTSRTYHALIVMVCLLAQGKLILGVHQVRSADTTPVFRGDATQYTLDKPFHGNCNYMSVPKDAITYYAAINAIQWLNTLNCGRCARVRCIDPQCTGSSDNEGTLVYLVDQCPECQYGDLDFSPDAFQAITGLQNTRLSIEWEFVDCPAAQHTNVQYCLKEGSNPYWTAIQPTQSRVGIHSLTINDAQTKILGSAYYFLLDSQQTDLSNVKISITAINGEIITDTKLSFTKNTCVFSNSQFQPGKPSTMDDEIPEAERKRNTNDHYAEPSTTSSPFLTIVYILCILIAICLISWLAAPKLNQLIRRNQRDKTQLERTQDLALRSDVTPVLGRLSYEELFTTSTPDHRNSYENLFTSLPSQQYK